MKTPTKPEDVVPFAQDVAHRVRLTYGPQARLHWEFKPGLGDENRDAWFTNATIHAPKRGHAPARIIPVAVCHPDWQLAQLLEAFAPWVCIRGLFCDQAWPTDPRGLVLAIGKANNLGPVWGEDIPDFAVRNMAQTVKKWIESDIRRLTKPWSPYSGEVVVLRDWKKSLTAYLKEAQRNG